VLSLLAIGRVIFEVITFQVSSFRFHVSGLLRLFAIARVKFQVSSLKFLLKGIEVKFKILVFRFASPVRYRSC